MSERDELAILGIIQAIERIDVYCASIENTDDFYDNNVVFDACLMNFVVIGEMVTRVSDDCRNANDCIPWGMIKAFRNVVAHDYFGVDAEEVWQIITNKLPVLKRQLFELISPVV